MTAASVAALTVYDMVKGVERGVEIRCAPARSRRPAARAASGIGRRRRWTARAKPRHKPRRADGGPVGRKKRG